MGSCVSSVEASKREHENENPYHVADYGLQEFIRKDQLKAWSLLKVGNVRRKCFESSNFRVVMEALDERIAELNDILPVQYIAYAFKGLIEPLYNKSSLSDLNLIEDVMVQPVMPGTDVGAVSGAAGAKAEMFWTTTMVRGTELCSILNAAIRNDDPRNIVHAAVFAKGMDMRRNAVGRRNTVDLTQKYPDVKATADMFPDGEFPRSLRHRHWHVCWRGGAFDDTCKYFFTAGQYYRCPGFLATSFRKANAMQFCDPESYVPQSTILWTVLVDGRGTENVLYRGQHTSFVAKKTLDGGDEFLFAPYSVFQVVATEWSSTHHHHHSVVLRAVVDNRKHEEDLPLAPWY